MTNTPLRKRLRYRRALLLLAYLGFLLFLCEAGSWATFWLISGQRYSGAIVEAQIAHEAGAAVKAHNLKVPGSIRGTIQARNETIHPYLGYLPRFGAKQIVPNGVSLNEERFYSKDSPVFSPSKDTIVIGITGGSVANHFARFGGKALIQELSRLPAWDGKDIQLAVMAFGGFKQPQQLMAVNYVLALGGRFDLIINLDGFNEIALHETDNAPQGVAPAYPRSWLFRVYSDHVLGPLMGELSYLTRARSELAHDTLRSRWIHSWTYRLSWKIRDRWYKDDIRQMENSLRTFEPTPELALTGPRTAAVTEAGRTKQLADIWANSSLLLDQLCRAHGIEYYQFLQPNQYVPKSKPLSDEELNLAYNANHKYGRMVSLGYPMLLRAGQELIDQEVNFRDLTGIFRDVEETLYIDDCCHLNERGNELMALEIARFIGESQD